MHIIFKIGQRSDRTESAFRLLRVSMFKLYFKRWAEQHNIKDYQFSSHEGTVRIQFKHASEYSMFGLVWDNYNNYEYAIVKA